MIEHVVLFKLKPDAPRDAAERVQNALHGLRGCVPGMLQYVVTQNFSGRSQGFDLVLFSRFASRQALDVYAVHPAHVRVVDSVVKPLSAELIVADGQV